ncbi:MAG TPA: NADH-quinone oxidoreductase subunit C [Candidatus Margulisiibacteriota bacterium]|nr:NADH-quinone oxidoreductase subunit C [Candidatus Margulisiibacteriota bacterium]
MDAAGIHQRLTARFEASVGDCDVQAKDPFIRVEPAAIVPVCQFLRDEPDLQFNVLSNETGVDYKAKGVIEVVYHLYSYPHRHAIVLKVDAPRDNPVVPSVETVWKAANWLEREIYDLLGVTFEGHSDLRRLLMPEDWIGYPLRKDFVEPEEYHGISTRRESLLR